MIRRVYNSTLLIFFIMAISTNKDYLLKSLAKFNISEDDVDVMLADSSDIDPEGTLDVSACKNAIYKSMSSILPLSNVGEGGYSVSWNIDALKLWYNALCKELKKPNALKPAIRDKSNYW